MNWGIHDRRGWMAVVLLLCAYPFSAQNTGQITLELRNKPLPAVLKRKRGRSISFFPITRLRLTMSLPLSIKETNRKHFPSF